jgi:hypothetical protein
VLSPESEEEKITKRLDELTRAVAWDGAGDKEASRAQHINELFQELLLPECIAKIPDLPSGDGTPAALAMLAMGASRRSSSLGLALERVSTRVAKDRKSAHTSADAVLTALHEGMLDKQKRRVALDWLARSGKWRILTIAVEPADHDEPEARP